MSSSQSHPEYIQRRTAILRRAAEAKIAAGQSLRAALRAQIDALEPVPHTTGYRTQLVNMLVQLTELEVGEHASLADVLAVRREAGGAT